MPTLPYDDDYMTYDYNSHRYVLTLQDVKQNLGVDLENRITFANAIPTLLNRISVKIYAYIHTHNVMNDYQNYIIAKTEKGREIIKSAMEEQLLYLLTVGDLSRSIDINERALAIDDTAKQILLDRIPEIGCSICYCGKLPIVNLGDNW